VQHLRRGDPVSIWNTTAVETEPSQNSAVEGQVDVAIVGGGFTGLSTALHCVERGLSCHVLEASQIGFGGSGRNVGLVNAAAWLPPQDVRKILGEDDGDRFISHFSRAPDYVFSLIEKYQIQCNATQTGTFHAADGPVGFADLVSRKVEWDRLGEPVDLLSRDEAESYIGSSAFYGALLDRRAGTINPMGYCRGLARVAIAAGALISIGARAKKLQQETGLWRVTTNKGTLMARHVVLGTNAYTDDLWPGLKYSFTKINYFQLATRPLGDRIKHILPQKQGLWDTGKIMFSLRRDDSKRLIIGSMGNVMGNQSGGVSHRWAQKKLAHLFPKLGWVDFDEAWQGQIAMTPDHLPHIHKLADNLYSPIGYNGRGITTGTVFGQALADLLTGDSEKKLPVPLLTMRRVGSAPVMSCFYKIAFAANQIIKSL
jgi:glycine/D-amino acid oxidase-like deaminating enzyme